MSGFKFDTNGNHESVEISEDGLSVSRKKGGCMVTVRTTPIIENGSATIKIKYTQSKETTWSSYFGILDPNQDFKAEGGKCGDLNAFALNLKSGAVRLKQNTIKYAMRGYKELKDGDTIGCTLDLESKTLNFFKNDYDLGEVCESAGFSLGQLKPPYVFGIDMHNEMETFTIVQ